MMIIKTWSFLLFKLISDVVSINLSFVLAYMIAFKISSIFNLQILAYIKVLAFLSLFWVIIFNLAGLYKLQSDRANRIDGVFSISLGVFSSAFLTYMFVEFLYREAVYSHKIVIIASIIALLLINIFRSLIWRLFSRQ